MSPPAPISDLDRVVDRLRQLELRLTSLGGKETVQPEALRAVLHDREQTRGKIYAEAVRQASAFALDLTKAVDARVSVRVKQVADRAVARLDATLPPLLTVPVERRLDEYEKSIPVLMERFAALRHSAATLEQRLAAAGDSLDTLWKQQDTAGLGGWRLVMRAVSAQVELEKEQKPAFVNPHQARPDADAGPAARTANIVCPRCKDLALRRIARESLIEELLRVVFVAPYRCTNCGIRSYHFRYTVKTAG